MFAMFTTEGVFSWKSATVCSSSGDSSAGLGLGACLCTGPITIHRFEPCQAVRVIKGGHAFISSVAGAASTVTCRACACGGATARAITRPVASSMPSTARGQPFANPPAGSEFDPALDPALLLSRAVAAPECAHAAALVCARADAGALPHALARPSALLSQARSCAAPPACSAGELSLRSGTPRRLRELAATLALSTGSGCKAVGAPCGGGERPAAQWDAPGMRRCKRGRGLTAVQS